MNGFKKDESFIEKVYRGEELSFIVADSCYSIECKVQKNKLRGLNPNEIVEDETAFGGEQCQ